jgi:hypothetical protein
MATITAKAAGGKWGSTTTWEPEQVPTAADDVILASTSGSVEIAAEAFCRSLEASAYQKTLSLPTQTLVIGTSTSNAGLALAFGKSMTLSLSGSAIKFVSTAAEVQRITTGGRTMPRVIFKAPGGKWQLQDKYEAGGGRIELEEGELATNGQECKLEAGLRSPGTATRTLSLGASTVLLTGTGTVWELVATGLTVALTAATIGVTNQSTTLKTFKGGGASYGTVTFSGNYIEVQGANTFATLNVNTARKATTIKGTLVSATTTLTVTEGALPAVGEELKSAGIPTGTIVLAIVNEVAKTVEMSAAATETVSVAEVIEVFPAGLLLKQGETQTVTTFATNGKAGELARLASSLSGKPATITKATGQVSVNFMILKDSKAAGITEWYAGTGSRNATGDSVWKFEAAPPFFEGTASVRSGLGMGASGAKVASGVAAMTTGARNVATGAKAGTGVAVLPSAARVVGSGAKLASGVSATPSGAHVAPLGAKGASGVGALPSASRLAASGAKLAAGVPALRSAVRASAVAAGKSTTGEGRVRGAVEVLGESSELQRSGRSTVPSGTKTASTGSKGAQGTGAVHQASRAVSVAVKSTSGAAGARAGVNVSAVAGKLASGAATIRAAIRAVGAGGKAPTGEAKIAAAVRTQATGSKGGIGAPTVSTGARQGATGSKATSGSVLLPVANRIAVLVSKTTVGEAFLRVAARWVGLTRPKATTLEAVSRSPTSLYAISRSPTTLTAVSRSPTTLQGGTK